MGAFLRAAVPAEARKNRAFRSNSSQKGRRRTGAALSVPVFPLQSPCAEEKFSLKSAHYCV
jgi:hypothetical protein